MRKGTGKRVIAFFMAFIMALSVIFQSDMAIGGFAKVLAADTGGIATPTDADSEAQLADTGAIDLNADGYYAYLKNLPNGKIYTGNAIKIDSNIGVKKVGDTSGTTALSSTLYTISYENNVNAGTATAIITGKPDMNCTGTLTVTFTIRPKTISTAGWFYVGGTDASNKYSNSTSKYYTYQAQGVVPKIYVRSSANGPFLTEGVDYQVEYWNVDRAADIEREHMGNGPFAIVESTKNSNYAIGGSNGYFDIFYGINAADLETQTTISLEGESFVYTGKPIKPKVEVIDKTNNKKLYSVEDTNKEDYEYKVEYSNNTNPGTATVTITGHPNRFQGSVTKTFTILNSGSNVKNIADADAVVTDEFTYDGEDKTPEPVVTYKGTTLVKDRDYKIAYYTDNINATTAKKKASVTISGLNSFTGSKTIQFDIAPKSIDTLNISISDAVYNTANNIAMAVVPTVKITDPVLGTTLSTGDGDYFLDFSEYRTEKNYNVGEHSFKLTMYNNYTGSKICTFNTVATSIAPAVITVEPVEYTGAEVKPVPSKVTFSNTTLEKGVDYEITGYKNNVELGSSAIITITGKGNFKGTAMGTFTIKTSKIGMTDVTIPDIGKMAYTGSQIKPDITPTYDGRNLVEGTDYTVTYGDNLSPKDTGSVTFVGKGDYAGTVTKTFKIVAKDISANDVILTRNKVNYEYTGSPIDPDITVTYNGIVLEKGVDYKVMNLYTEPGTYNMVISGAAGSTPYFTGMRIFQITITAPAGEMADLEYAPIPDQYYAGKAITPTLTIKKGDYTLQLDKDYVIKSITGNTEVGVATVEIEGTGSYSGTKSLEFNIVPKPIEDCTITGIEDTQYEMGAAIEPAVTVKNGTVELVQGRDYTLAFNNNIDVSDSAEVVITAKSSNYTGDATKIFKITPVSITAAGNGVSITNADATQEYTGTDIEPEIKITRYYNRKIYTLEQGKDYTVVYENNREVTGSGDRASITVTGTGNFSGQTVIRFEISKRSISSCAVESVPDQQWTGSEIKPDVAVYNGIIKLENGGDYDVIYSDNTDEGEASYTVIGKGDHYTGSVTKYFRITKEFINIEDNDKIAVSNIENQTYRFGAAITPNFTVTYDGEKLTDKEDYTYSFTNNKNVGTATLTVTGVGRFKGTLTYTFNILPYDISGDTLVIDQNVFEYTGTPAEPRPVSIKSGNNVLVTDFTGFTVSYSDNTEAGTGSVTVTAGTTGNFIGSLTQRFTIGQQSINSAKITVNDVTYTGEAQTPDVTVTLADGRVLSADDYTVKYKNNRDVGTATVIVTAVEGGNYTGSVEGSFKIQAIDIADAVITAIEDQTYTGSAICPDIEVKYGDKILAEGEDYVVDSYTDNENVSTVSKKACVTIKGKGIYVGTCSAKFSIVPASIENAVVSGYSKNVEYTGSAITFTSLTVKVGEKVLTSSDYKVTYSNNTDVTTEKTPAKITITAAGNYTDSIVVQFAITARNLENCNISDIEGQIYTGKQVKPDVEVRDGAKTLVKGTDYDIEYSNNTEVTTEAGGLAVAKIIGKGNYTGEVKKTFSIAKEIIDISSAVVTIADGGSFIYNFGDEIEPKVTVKLGDKVLDASAYTVRYTDNVNAGKATITVTGTGDYKGQTGTTFVIEQYDITSAGLVLESDSYTYSGSEIKPEVKSITAGNRKITPGSDFDVAYSNNIKKGTGTVSLTARANTNYKGTASAKFTIGAADITSARVTVPDAEYTGLPVKPDVTVVLGTKKLTEGTDYTVEFADNTSVGTATVTVEGTGNYAGTVNAQFKITAKSLSLAVVTAKDQTYTGKALKPAVAVTLDGKTIADTEYDVTYSSNINKGTATVTVTGKNNYTGSKSGSFKILAKDIEECDVSDVADVVYNGKAQTPEITVKNGDVELKSGVDYEAVYSNNTDVSTTAKKAEITITGHGNYTGQKIVSFNITKAAFDDAVITGIPESEAYTGDSIILTGYEVTVSDVKLTENKDYTVSYKNNKEVGTATVIFTGAGNYEGSREMTFDIVQRNVADCQISAIPGQKWTGKPVAPAVTVKNGSVSLVSGTDYTVEYANNTDVTDKAEAIITGQGNYTGSITVYFSISRSVVSISTATISAIPAQTYAMGAEIKPSVNVVYDGMELTEDKDYTVSYANNIDAGTAEVTVTGIGYYSGSKTVSFAIEPLDVSKGSIKLESDSFVYNGKAQIPVVTGIEIGSDVQITDMSSFDVAYADNINAGTAKVTLTAKNNTNFKGSVTANYRITEADISAAIAVAEAVVYQGTALKPAVKVTLGGVNLVDGKDYEVAYSSNVNVGKGKAVITGAGNYKGQLTVSFDITARSLTGADVQIADQVYTGKALSPKPVVTLADKTLVQDVDYTVTYEKNVNVGTANVIIAGTGNYKDSVKESFKIAAADIGKAEASAIADQVYTGSEITPDVQVTTTSGKVLAAGVDYEITYTGNVNVSTKEAMAQAVIVGKGNYTGTLKAAFAIISKNIASVSVSGYSESVAYTGSNVEFDNIIVTDDNDVLTAGVDYTISYMGNKSVTTDDGTYFTVTGKGNYTGTKDVHFTITKKNIKDCDVQAIESQIWTGKEIKPEVTIRNGSALLVSGTDYEVEYSNNINETTDTSKALAVITGNGNYTGSITREFTISRILSDISKAEVSAIPAQTYDFGREITPDVTVKYDGKVLTKNVDYKLAYTDNINVGTATVSIVGIGGYNKSVSKTFAIKAADISKGELILKGTSFVYTGEAINPSVTRLMLTVAEGTEIITDLASFDVKYTDNVNAGKATVSLTAKGGTNFTGTATATFQIERASLADAVVEASSPEYTGDAVTPDITVRIGEKVLESGTDYEITYTDNVDAGDKAGFTITGKGNYEGVINRTFEIQPKSIANGECEIPSQVYTGSDITPDVTVSVDGKVLVAGRDYTVVYSDNRDVTTADRKASAVITAMGNYTGKLTVQFEITAKTILPADVSDIEAQEYTGSAIEPKVTVKNGTTILVAGRDYDVAYSDNVDKTKSAKAVITGKGNYRGVVAKTFEICATSIASAVVTGIPESAVYTGESITFDNIKVQLGGKTMVYGSDYSVSYERNVNATTDESKAYVIIKGMDNYGGQIRVAFDITPKSISGCKVDAINGQIYTGSEVAPDVTVRDGSVVLEKDVDYTVTYKENVEITKSAKAVITGKGNYEGELVAEFSISKEVLDISAAKIASIADQYYNFGSELTPDVKVILNGKTLVKGVDYDLTYANNVKPGKAAVTVKGIDQNKGEVSGTFNILPIDITTADITLVKNSYAYTGNAVNAEVSKVTVKRNGVAKTLTDLTGFTYSCSNNVNVGKAVLTLTAEDGMGFAGSATVNYTITAASIEQAVISADSAAYTGEAIIPVCRVTLAGKTLIPGTDYTIAASNNINVTDDAVVTITGKGNYSGKAETYFSITPKRISSAELTVADAEYTGAPLEPAVTVILDGKTLKAGTDYTADYSDNVNVTAGSAKASVTVTGKGNYTGAVDAEFAITPMDISKLSIEDIPAQVYAGRAVRPEVTIRNGDVVLTAGADYSVEYQDNEAVTKTAKAVITGKGNYNGSVTKTFVITALSIEDAEISGIADTVVYSGEDIEFSGIKVTVNGIQLANGTDYTVAYKNNHDVTTDELASVIITGQGNYGGEVSRTFTITAKNIVRCSIDPIGGQIYTGSPVTPEIVVRDGAIVLEKDKDYTVEYSKNTDVTENAGVTVIGKGNYKGTISTVFTIAKEIIDISKAQISKPGDEYYDFGNPIKPDVTLTYKGKQLTKDVDYELVYIGNTKEGTATIQANGINTNTGSVSTTFEILPIDISDAVVTLENEEYEYTGREIKPEVRMIMVKRSGKSEAVTSLDGFNVTYDSNINVGTANVTVAAVKGSGFTGKTVRTFEITKVDMADAVVEIDGSYEYTGSAIAPKYTVILDGKTLKEGTDYTAVCSNNVNVGKRAMVTVTGAGNYTGTTIGYFEITAKNISGADVAVADAEFTGIPVTPAITVTVDGEILNADIDYTISYNNNINATTDKTKAAVVIKGTGNYTGTVTCTFDIAPKDISGAVISDIEAQNYTGKEVTPEFSVNLDGKVLAAGTDYAVSYENNIAASDDAVAIVTGRGNYTGSISKKFAIQNVDITDAAVTGIEESVVYTGKEITFGDIMVTVSGRTLSEDEDYIVSYENNKNVTTSAKVVITGTGNYSGVITKTFAITPKNIAKCSVDAVSGQIYTAKSITPEVTVRDGSSVLVLSQDYTVSYSNNVEVTTADSMAVITVTGKGNYTGKTTVTFAISKKLTDISKAVISKIADQHYNFGQPLTPDATVTLNGKELVNGTDYALVYVDNTDEGTATVTAKGINSNTGSVTAKFNIKPIDISDGVIALDAATYLYTGTAVKPEIISFTVKRLGKTVTVTDFDNLDITYSSNSDVGTGKITITALEGEGFTGSVSKTFTIVGASVENAVVRVENGVYTGEEVEPSYVVTLGGRTLVSGKDFRADFSNNVNATDSAVLTITGINNYSGTKSVRFTISPRRITDADITVAAARYTGQSLTPALTVTIGGMTLVQDVDFTAEYIDNVNVTDDETKASVKVTGIGNYTGNVSEEFEISPRDISLASVADIDSQAYTGNPVMPEPVVTDGTTVLKAGRDYVVSYRNNTNVTAEAGVIITGKGNYTGSVVKIFAIAGADIKDAVVTGVKSSVTYTGSEITFTGLKVTYGDGVLVAGRDYTVTYSNNRNVTDKAEVRIAGNGNYTGTVIKTFAIKQKNIADDDCHVSEIGGQIYTGKEIEPAVVVTYGDITLVEDVDYEITYSNNIEASAKNSPAKAVITGKGSYTGIVLREFTITKEPVNISGAKISAIDDQEFAKTFITPAVDVTYAGKALVEGTDYKVSYSNNYNVGTATVYITGYGNYVGSKKITFNITKRDITGYTAVLAQTDMTYTGKTITPDVVSISSADGSFIINDEELDTFVVKYAGNVNAGTAKVTATAGSNSNYTGSVTAQFKIAPAQLNGAVATAETTEYTGSAVTPAVAVTKNGVVLSADDYSVEYRSNTDVGTAEIIVTGKGNYTGTVHGSFEITAGSIKNCTITVTASTEYTGGQIVPVVTVKNGTKLLANGVDYILSYDQNSDVTSKAKVVITGKGNYKDSVTRYFAITGRSITKAVVCGVIDKEFTGNAITQNIEVKLDGETLVQGTDYTVKYINNVHVGTATVVITGTGNYTESVKKNFVINRVDVSNTAVITGIEPEATYTGTAFKFKNVKITWSGIVLREGRDYTISYKNNSGITMTRTSKASCTVTFNGDYKGKVTKQFRIKAFDISKATVSVIKDVTYNGKAKTPTVVAKIGSTTIDPAEYEVKYSNNVKPGVATVTITGLNNFYGTKKVTFNILPERVAGLQFVTSTTSAVRVKWNKVKYAAGYVVYYSKDGKSYKKFGTTKDTTMVLSKLASGQTYKVAVYAYVTSNGKNLISTKSEVVTGTKPGKVTGITYSSRTDTVISVKWNKVSGATGYKVYRTDDSGKKVMAVGTVKTNAVSIKKLKASTVYKIKVVAYKSVGGKVLLGTANVAAIMTTPSAVKGLKTSRNWVSSIALSWNKVASADGYIVYRLSGKNWIKIKQISKNTTVSFISSKLRAGTEWKYKVVAYKKHGNSVVKNVGSQISSVTLPTAPVVVIRAGKGSVTLGWNGVTGADGYEVYMRTTKKGKSTKIATLKKASKVKYTKKGLAKNKTYYVNVRAFKKDAKGRKYYSSYSTVKAVKAK